MKVDRVHTDDIEMIDIDIENKFRMVNLGLTGAAALLCENENVNISNIGNLLIDISNRQRELFESHINLFEKILKNNIGKKEA